MYRQVCQSKRASSSSNVLALGIVLGSLLRLAVLAPAETTTWTYQGSLRDGEAPANGTYDFRFTLFDDPLAGVQLDDPDDQADIVVTDGLFTVLLDFGDQFNGDDVWLEIAVRPGDSEEEHTVLSPRQWLTPVPYASGLILPYDGSIFSPLAAFSMSQTGPGQSGFFEIDHAGNDSNALRVQTNGTGDVLRARTTGTGSAAFLDISNAANDSEVLHIQTSGTGEAIIASAGGNSTTIVSYANGTGKAGLFQASAGNPTTALEAVNHGSGRAGFFEISDSLNNSPALQVRTNANGGAYPDGIALLAQTTGNGDTYGVWAETDSPTGLGILGQASSASENAVGIGVRGESAGELGVGVFGASTWTATREGFPSYGVWGVVESATSGAGSAGVYGVNNGTEPIQGEFPPIRYGVFGHTLGYGYGVYGTTSDAGGVGVKGEGPVTGVSGLADNASGITYGVKGVSDSTSGRGVFGQVTAESGSTYGVFGETASSSGRGVIGKATDPSGATRGVYGLSESTGGSGLYGYASASSGTTYGVYSRINSAEGYLFYGNGSGADAADFYVTDDGQVRADGTYSGPADFAELMQADGSDPSLEPGDVVVFGDGFNTVRLATRPNDPMVVGVYSTKPGFLGRQSEADDPPGPDDLPVALVGIVPVKVSNENGAIRLGDLLTTSSTPGHAMKAKPIGELGGRPVYEQGTIIGKAMEDWDAEAGKIRMLVLPR